MDDKCSVLFVMDGLKIGGVESALISVFHFFDFEKYQVDLLLLHRDDALIDKIPQNVNIIYLDEAKSSGKDIKFCFLWVLYKFCSIIGFKKYAKLFAQQFQNHAAANKAKKILRQDYDQVIAYKHGEAENFVAFSVKSNNKILFYHHGSIIDDELHIRAFPHFKRIVAVSEGVKEMLREAYPKFQDKLIVIPNYVDSEYIRKRAKEYKVERPKVNIVLCTVGRISPEKNYKLAVQTALELKKRQESFIWYFIGEGEERLSIDRIVSKNELESNIVLTGSLRNPLPYVALCDVYVQTSDVESYGLSIQEALILGKPVVSTKTIGGLLLLSKHRNSTLVESDCVQMVEGIYNCLHLKSEDISLDWIDKDKNTQLLWETLLK